MKNINLTDSEVRVTISLLRSQQYILRNLPECKSLLNKLTNGGKEND